MVAWRGGGRVNLSRSSLSPAQLSPAKQINKSCIECKKFSFFSRLSTSHPSRRKKKEARSSHKNSQRCKEEINSAIVLYCGNGNGEEWVEGGAQAKQQNCYCVIICENIQIRRRTKKEEEENGRMEGKTSIDIKVFFPFSHKFASFFCFSLRLLVDRRKLPDD